MKGIVLAAGYATRLYPLTEDRPKPLLRVGEKTILDYLLDGLKSLSGLDVVCIVTNEKFYSTFQEWSEIVKSSGRYPDFQINIVNDGTTSNETRLGAIADIQYVIGQEHIDDELLVAAGDNIFQCNFTELERFYRTKQSDVIVAQELNDPERLKQRGVVLFDENNKVISFEEKPDHPKSNYVCPALYIHKRETVPMYKKYLDAGNNPDAPGHFIKWLYPKISLHAFVMEEPAIDIGTKKVYEHVYQDFKMKRNLTD